MRILRGEHLEPRQLLVGEGEIFSINRSFNTLAFAGNLSAVVDWGDGTQSAGTVDGGGAVNKISVRIDYSLDSNGFFTTARRQLLQSVVDSIVGKFNDTLKPIQPAGGNEWTAVLLHPSTGQQVTRSNLRIAENELLVFAGARPMPGPQLGTGGPGGFSAFGSNQWLNDVATRGQGTVSGGAANDFGPWGGSIAFDTTANWYFGADAEGIQADEADFVTTAVHEFIHLLGFGVSDSWNRLVSGNSFTGANARSEYDGSGNVPLSPDRQHWQVDLEDNGLETIMDPDQFAGTRKTATPLDYAALEDIGWSIPNTVARVTAEHVYPDNGSYPVTVTLVGSRLGEASDELSASITNLPPTLTVPNTQTILAGQTLNLTDIGQISDPGFRNTRVTPATQETFTYVINWGDGSPLDQGDATIDRIGNAQQTTLASFNGSHVFEEPGNYTVEVSARDDDGGAAAKTFVVNVLAPPLLSMTTNRSRIVEDGSVSATITLRRSGGFLGQPLTVNLRSNDTTEATVPANIAFAANQNSVTFPVNAVDDTLLDGDQTVEIRATANNAEVATLEITVADAEQLEAQFLVDVIDETAGENGATLRITRSNTDTSNPLIVQISGGNAATLEPITEWTIPANQQSTDLRFDVYDDDLPERRELLSLTVRAAGYASASDTLTVRDNEPPKFQNPSNAFDVSGDGNVRPIDALQVINFLNRSGGPQSLDPSNEAGAPYYDVSGDYEVTPLDALRIINAINRGETGGEGEGDDAGFTVALMSITDELERQRLRSRVTGCTFS